jgi:hypothetical protein
VIPLGILAAAGGAVASVGSYDLLATEILTGSQSSVTFASLGTYAADYQHLQIRMVTRGTGISGTVLSQFNADTGNNYSVHRLYGDGSSVNSNAFTSRANLFAGANVQSDEAAGAFAASVLDILDPFATTKYTTTRSLGGTKATNNFVTLLSGNWRNTDALTQILIYPNAGSHAAGSRFSLYGIRKAA